MSCQSLWSILDIVSPWLSPLGHCLYDNNLSGLRLLLLYWKNDLGFSEFSLHDRKQTPILEPRGQAWEVIRSIFYYMADCLSTLPGQVRPREGPVDGIWEKPSVPKRKTETHKHKKFKTRWKPNWFDWRWWLKTVSDKNMRLWKRHNRNKQ